MTARCPHERILTGARAAVRADADYVLYWMTSARRTAWNWSLDRAVEWCVELNRPLLVFEPLRAGYPWACARHSAFVVDGMLDNAAAFRAAGIAYYPYVEPTHGAGRGLLEALAAHACVVVADDYPHFFLPRMLEAAEARSGVRMERVDSNGVHPMRATSDRAFATAASFRRELQRTLWPRLRSRPSSEPLAASVARGAVVPGHVLARWPAADPRRGADAIVATTDVPETPARASMRGGRVAGLARLDAFVSTDLVRYDTDRNEVDGSAASGLSPYLHFGHIAGAEVVARVLDTNAVDLRAPAAPATGSRAGWWSAPPGAEAFLDQVVTWRELGFNRCVASEGRNDTFESLPDWARATLERHAVDERPVRYELGDLERSATDDPLWNAAQRQLATEGVMHNYLRMLWAKRILEWAPHPATAVEWAFELNDRYALDGRDPNSVTGITWAFGRYDRPWGPERPIFGTIRYMSSANTYRKLDVREYLRRYGPPVDPLPLFAPRG